MGTASEFVSGAVLQHDCRCGGASWKIL